MKLLKKLHTKFGFTLLEIGVVLVIVGVVVAATMGMFSKSIDNTQLKETQNKTQVLQKALQDYANTNNRMPCPADPTVAMDDATYGKEISSGGTSYSSTDPNSYNCNGAHLTVLDVSKTYQGMPPVKTLGLPDDAAVDGWGHRIIYVVNNTFTKPDAFTNVSNTDTGNYITIQDAAGNKKNTGAMFVLYSAGVNGHGAYPRNGGSKIVNPNKTAGTANADELKNCHCTVAGADNSLDAVFIQKSTNVDASYDDMLVYGTRAQFVASSMNCANNQKVDTNTHTCVTKNCADDGYGCAGCSGQQTLSNGVCSDPSCNAATENLVAHNCVPKTCSADFSYDPATTGAACDSSTQNEVLNVTHHATAIGDCPTTARTCNAKTCAGDFGYDPTTTGSTCNASTQNEVVNTTHHATAIGDCPTNVRSCNAKTCAADFGFNPATTGSTSCVGQQSLQTATTHHSTAIGDCPTNAYYCQEPSCGGGQVLDPATHTCIASCSGGSSWNGSSCVCPGGQFMYSGTCDTCSGHGMQTDNSGTCDLCSQHASTMNYGAAASGRLWSDNSGTCMLCDEVGNGGANCGPCGKINGSTWNPRESWGDCRMTATICQDSNYPDLVNGRCLAACGQSGAHHDAGGACVCNGDSYMAQDAGDYCVQCTGGSHPNGSGNGCDGCSSGNWNTSTKQCEGGANCADSQDEVDGSCVDKCTGNDYWDNGSQSCQPKTCGMMGMDEFNGACVAKCESWQSRDGGGNCQDPTCDSDSSYCSPGSTSGGQSGSCVFGGCCDAPSYCYDTGSCPSDMGGWWACPGDF